MGGNQDVGWCTGPASRIQDCCGGCCPDGDVYLMNGNCKCTRPDAPECMVPESWWGYQCDNVTCTKETGVTVVPGSKGGCCLGWKQTQNCDPHGPPDSADDKSCGTVIRASFKDSGYCLCQNNVKVYGNGCYGLPGGFDGKTCNDVCSDKTLNPTCGA